MARDSWKPMYNSMNAWISNHMYDIVGSVSIRFALYFWSLAHRREKNGLVPHSLETGVSNVAAVKIETGKRLNIAMSSLLGSINGFMILDKKGNRFSAQDCQFLSEIFLAISSACNKTCVGSVMAGQSISTKPSAVYDKWIVATAPARNRPRKAAHRRRQAGPRR